MRLSLPAGITPYKNGETRDSNTPLIFKSIETAPLVEISAAPLAPVRKPEESGNAAGGNGHGQLGGRSGNGNGELGGGSGNGNGANRNDELPAFQAPRRKCELNKSEKKYLKKTVPARNAPPYDLTVVHLVHAAAYMTHCINGKKNGVRRHILEECKEAKLKLEAKQAELEDSMLLYSGRALKKIEGVNETVKLHLRFIDKVMMRLAEFENTVEPVIWTAHKLHRELQLERKIKLAEAEKPPILDALGKASKSVDKLAKGAAIAFAAIVVEAAATYWAEITGIPVEVHSVLLSLGVLGTLYLTGSWIMGQIKKEARERVIKEYDEKLKCSCAGCRRMVREKVELLARELIGAVRAEYKEHADAQIKIIADFVKDRLRTDLARHNADGTFLLPSDDVMAEMLAKAVCRL